MTSRRRALYMTLTWVAATVFGLAFAAWTAVGPVLITLAPGHGVHLGDLVALLAAYTRAGVLTHRLMSRHPEARFSPGVRQ